jgi:hypothetical protein
VALLKLPRFDESWRAVLIVKTSSETEAADACRTGGKDSERQLDERINELAVAKVLADEKHLRGPP